MNLALNILGATASVALAGGICALMRARRADSGPQASPGDGEPAEKAPAYDLKRACLAAAVGGAAGVGIATVSPGTMPGIVPAFCGLLGAASAFDMESRTIPVHLLAAMVVFGVLGCPTGILNGALAAIATAAVSYGASLIGERSCGKEVFGLGDVLLVAAIAPMVCGSMQSIQAALLALTIELAIVLAWMKKTGSDHFVAFAPLALAPVAISLLFA